LRICFPHKPGSGGPGIFQQRLEDQLRKAGHTIGYKGQCQNPDLIFIVGGTRALFWLMIMRLMKVPILLRLDGIPWLHRKIKFNFNKYYKAEVANFLNKFYHAFLANIIVYQSNFTKDWWERKGWRKTNSYLIIHNGVKIPMLFVKNEQSLDKKMRLVVLEGTIDYSPYAIRLLNDLSVILSCEIQIEVYGRFENREMEFELDNRIKYCGFIENERVFEILNNSIYLSLDINPACPNTVIEALAVGAPVVAFDTGSLKELVKDDAGLIVPYGSNPWNLEYPNVKGIANAILQIKLSYNYYSFNAKKLAEREYSVELMFNQYLEILTQLKVLHDE